MTPFRIRCTTCQARLSVRSPRALGQLITCPKCGSMVLVPKRPPQPSASEPAPPAADAPRRPRPAAPIPGRPAATASGLLITDTFDHLDRLLASPVANPTPPPAKAGSNPSSTAAPDGPSAPPAGPARTLPHGAENAAAGQMPTESGQTGEPASAPRAPRKSSSTQQPAAPPARPTAAPPPHPVGASPAQQPAVTAAQPIAAPSARQPEPSSAGEPEPTPAANQPSPQPAEPPTAASPDAVSPADAGSARASSPQAAEGDAAGTGAQQGTATGSDPAEAAPAQPTAAGPAAPDAAAAPGHSPIDPLEMPTAAAVSPAAQLWRLRLLVASGVVGAALTAGALTAYWNRTRSGADSPAVAQHGPPANRTTTESQSPDGATAEDPHTGEDPAAAGGTQAAPPSGDAAGQKGAEPVSEPAESPAPGRAPGDAPPDQPPDAAPPHVVQRPAAEPPDPATGPATRPPQAPEPAGDPAGPEASSPASDAPGPGFSAPDYASLFSQPSQPWLSSGRSPLWGESSRASGTALPEIDVKGRLARTLVGIDLKDMPLADFWNLFTQLSGVPVTVEPDALALTGVSLDTPVQVHADHESLGRILEAVLRPLRLVYSIQPHGVRITHRPTDPAMPEVRYDVRDLAAGEDQVAELARWIEQLTDQAGDPPAGAEVQVQGTALAIRQPPLVHFQILRILEQLRLARGLPVRSRFPESLFALQPDSQRMKTRVSIHYWIDRPLLGLLTEWTAQSGIPLVVDWEALAETGWSPMSATTWTAGETTAEEAIAGLCEANEWTYRWLPVGAVQVTSRRAAAQHHRVELYRLAPWTAPGQSPKQAADRLYQAARKAAAQPDSVLLVLDAPSSSALVRTDAMAHQALAQQQQEPSAVQP